MIALRACVHEWCDSFSDTASPASGHNYTLLYKCGQIAIVISVNSVLHNQLLPVNDATPEKSEGHHEERQIKIRREIRARGNAEQ
jgi:hypothetical protein